MNDHTPEAHSCPACGKPLTAANLNITQGVALCPHCGGLTRLDRLLRQAQSPDRAAALASTPFGCSMREEGSRVILRASARSFSGALGSLLISVFWNGITYVFVFIAFVGLYTNIIGPLPRWFPSPSSGQPMPLAMAIVLALFIIPFVIIGGIFITSIFHCLFGFVEVQVDGAAGLIRAGVGPFARRRTFDAASVRSVRIGASGQTRNRRTVPAVIIAGPGKPVRFGTTLSTKRRTWLAAALAQLLTP